MATEKQLAALKKARAAKKKKLSGLFGKGKVKRMAAKKNTLPKKQNTKKRTPKLNEFGRYGEQFTQFKGKPVEAIKWLMKVQRGECIGALYREGLGYIDLVWGEVTDYVKHTGKGLKHILDKHGKEFDALGYKPWEIIPSIIEMGDFYKERSNDEQLCFQNEHFRFVVALDYHTPGKKWLLTSFDLIKKPNK